MGEFELLARIRERLPAARPARLWLGSGDDAAVTVPGGATATSVDALVEGVHFRRQTSSLRQIGAKALAVALSDLAAMGAEAGEAYVVLGVPGDLDAGDCLELLDGMMALAAQTGTALAGGDVTRAPALTLALTVVGHAERPQDFATRAGAQPGDALVVTGELGGAAAGLLLLDREASADVPPLERPYGGLSDGTSSVLVARQLEPRPRLEEGRALTKAGATAMIDLSDGLSGDAGHIADESGVGLRIETAALPIAAGVAEVASAAGRDPLELATAGGEDYELLAAIPPGALTALPVELALSGSAVIGSEGATRLTQIGEVVAGSGVEIRLPGGGLLARGGFDQLS